MNQKTISTHNQWESKFGYARLNAIGNAHKLFFGDQHPCLTLVGVHRLISGECVIEIECDAYQDQEI